jgi:hypothetical protein
MKAIRLLLIAGLFGTALPAQEAASPVNLSDPLPTVVLSDGRILHDVKIVSFGDSAVVARWAGGLGTIAYTALPEPIRKVAEAQKPAPPQPIPPEAGGKAKAEFAVGAGQASALTVARRGFTTHLLRRESIGEAPDPPPAGVLELVSYLGPLGPMAAYVSPSPNDGRRHPAIIWLIGGSSNSVSSTAWDPQPPDNDQSASGFRASGIVMMYPSLRGGNKNPGHRERFFGEVDDVIAAARFLAKLAYVDPRRIYLGGHSTGGTLALLVAESSDQFRAVYALGAVGDMLGYGKDAVPFDLSNPKEVQLRSPKLWLDSIRVPTFVFEGTEAPANIQPLREMEGLNRNPLVRFREVTGGTHFTIITPLVREIALKIQQDDGK